MSRRLTQGQRLFYAKHGQRERQPHSRSRAWRRFWLRRALNWYAAAGQTPSSSQRAAGLAAELDVYNRPAKVA